GYAYGELGNFHESYTQNMRRLPIAKSLQDSDELIDAHTMVAVASLVLSNFGEVIENAVTATDIASETEKPRLAAQALQVESLARLLSATSPERWTRPRAASGSCRSSRATARSPSPPPRRRR